MHLHRFRYHSDGSWWIFTKVNKSQSEAGWENESDTETLWAHLEGEDAANEEEDCEN